MERQKFDRLLQAFDNGDHHTITEAFTDHAVWEILGHWTMSGKEEIRNFFSESDIEVVESVRERVIFNETTAVVESRGKCRNASGKEWSNWCCDIYDFAGDKVRRLRSFPIDRQ